MDKQKKEKTKNIVMCKFFTEYAEKKKLLQNMEEYCHTWAQFMKC